jgi:hypothetical protein
VVFVADDLGAWLVGLLADAGRKKLTALVLGGDQERALRKAAVAAVQDTAAEMSSSAEQGGQLAMVISEVFREPGPDAQCHGEQHEPQRDDDGEEQRDLGEQGAGGVVVAGGDAAD